jgi:hypothetical protein
LGVEGFDIELVRERLAATFRGSARSHVNQAIMNDPEWEQSNRANWRGLKLTDPIKNVEVCLWVTSERLNSSSFDRINGCYCLLF